MESSSEVAVQLITLEALGDSQVAVVDDTPHGTLAVGINGDEPFAVSNSCRHLFASLGKGDLEDGQLRCPSHSALYDVKTGKMTRGPQGGFKVIAGPVKATLGARALKVYPVEIRDGAIWLS
ncbi:MAG: Rieske 2Fe-2S domain-containing protein [Thermoleophilaceae bacterium]|nr:Rieske 2Fe-2S domain-containing protein [Thermoleophilaceae bacterium]